MRHRVAKKNLGRAKSHREAMVRNLLTSLIEHEKLETTHTRCKVLKSEFDKLVTLGKKGSLHARRLAAARLYSKKAVSKLFDELAPRYKNRNGGYTRIIQRGFRRGDAASVSIIECLPAGGEAKSTATKPAAEKENTAEATRKGAGKSTP